VVLGVEVRRGRGPTVGAGGKRWTRAPGGGGVHGTLATDGAVGDVDGGELFDRLRWLPPILPATYLMPNVPPLLESILIQVRQGSGQRQGGPVIDP